jgi:hypothetical protein
MAGTNRIVLAAVVCKGALGAARRLYASKHPVLSPFSCSLRLPASCCSGLPRCGWSPGHPDRRTFSETRFQAMVQSPWEDPWGKSFARRSDDRSSTASSCPPTPYKED